MAKHDITPQDFVNKHCESGALREKGVVSGFLYGHGMEKVIWRETLIEMLGEDFIRQCDKIVKRKKRMEMIHKEEGA